MLSFPATPDRACVGALICAVHPLVGSGVVYVLVGQHRSAAVPVMEEVDGCVCFDDAAAVLLALGPGFVKTNTIIHFFHLWDCTAEAIYCNQYIRGTVLASE